MISSIYKSNVLQSSHLITFVISFKVYIKKNVVSTMNPSKNQLGRSAQLNNNIFFFYMPTRILFVVKYRLIFKYKRWIWISCLEDFHISVYTRRYDQRSFHEFKKIHFVISNMTSRNEVSESERDSLTSFDYLRGDSELPNSLQIAIKSDEY